MDIKAHAVGMLNRLKLRWHTSRYRFPNDYRRIYHYHIRKSAGTSLNSAFWNLAGLTLRDIGRQAIIQKGKFVFVRRSANLINQGHYFYGNSHNSAHKLSLPDKTFTITILRDPLDRLLSYYRYLSYVRYNPLASEKEPFFQEVYKESGCLGEKFSDFLDNVHKRNLMNQIYMFSNTYDINEATERIVQCSAVCFTKTFSQDLANLNQHLNLSLTAKRDRAFKQEVEFSASDLVLARNALVDEFQLIEQVKKQLSINTST
ncbi:MAG: sulfotransferase family 2 domain-containing protein [Cyanobacteria bacterium P01_H01_bin.58]